MGVMKMEINLGNNIGARQDGFQVSGQGSEVAKTAASGIRQSASSLRTSDIGLDAFNPVKDSEPVSEVPESALMRDDELGKLVSAAFSLPAPPMPSFAE